MTQYLLDSDAVIDFLYDIADSVQLVLNLFAQGDRLCTCDVVVAEVYAGLHTREQPRAERLLTGLAYLPTTPEAARQAGAWRYAYLRQGHTIPITDCLIAAVAASTGATVVTREHAGFVPSAGEQQSPHRRVRRWSPANLKTFRCRRPHCCPSREGGPEVRDFFA